MSEPTNTDPTNTDPRDTDPRDDSTDATAGPDIAATPQGPVTPVSATNPTSSATPAAGDDTAVTDLGAESGTSTAWTDAADATDATEVPGADGSEAAPGSDDDTDEDLGAGAFDVPESEEEHDTKPKKAYLGRPELTPLYAMAGLADLAASVVRDIANEQIAAYRSKRTKGQTPADGVADAAEETAEQAAEKAKEANAQFNVFLAKVQERTQELFDEAVAQYEHLADRGRVAVGDVFEAAKQQQQTRGADDVIRMKPEDVQAAAQKAADKISAAAQAAAERVAKATSEDVKATDADAGVGVDPDAAADAGSTGPEAGPDEDAAPKTGV